MVDVTFDNVHFLWVLFTIPLMIALHFFLLKYTKRRAVVFANFEALKRVTGGMVLSKNITLLITRLVIILFLTLAASGLVIWTKAPSSDFDYVLAIDASGSMLAKDFTPDRITAAKRTAKDFIGNVVSDVNIGVVSFSGVPKVESELTKQKAKAEEALDDIEISATGGTDIGNALVTSTNMLVHVKERARSIILLTDGRHTVGGPLSEAVRYARQKEVTISAIGIATEAGGSFEQTQLLSTIDEEAMKGITSQTGGMFFKAGDEAEMKAAFDQIITSSEQNLPHPMRVWFLGLGLLFLFVEWGLINTRFRTLP